MKAFGKSVVRLDAQAFMVTEGTFALRTWFGFKPVRLVTFISALYPRPPIGLVSVGRGLLPWSTTRDRIKIDDAERAYRALILVGHSEGGVVIREAIRNFIDKDTEIIRIADAKIAAKSPEAAVMSQTKGEALERLSNPAHDSPLTASLKLFAPAILGRSLTGLIGIVRNLPLLGWLARSFLDFSTSATELDQSSILQDLQKFTERSAALYPKIHALKADIVHGSKDTVVFIGKYDQDVRHPNLDSHDHWSICKPTPQFTFPLDFVLSRDANINMDAVSMGGGRH